MKRILLICAIAVLAGGQEARADAPKKQDMPMYLKMLQTSSNAKDRAFAAEQIGRRGQIQVADVKSAIDPLLSAVKKDNSADVRRAAVAALGNIATQPETIVPALMEALKDKSINVNLAAVTALGQYGMEARQAIPALREFAKSKKDKKIMRMVNLAVKQINSRPQ
jgi:HEAT repeat protein